MDAFYLYTYGTAGWLSIQAIPLIIVPKLITAMLAHDAHLTTDLELYFARSFGFTLITITLIVLFFTGSIPLSTTIAQPVSLEDTDPKAPYAMPIIYVTTLQHCIGLIYCYVRYVNSYQTGYVLGATGYGLFSAIGIWCCVFGATEFRTSKRTGADKRMAGFPFKNANAYDKKWDRKQI